MPLYSVFLWIRPVWFGYPEIIKATEVFLIAANLNSVAFVPRYIIIETWKIERNPLYVYLGRAHSNDEWIQTFSKETIRVRDEL